MKGQETPEKVFKTLSLRKRKIKRTLRVHLTPVRMATIKQASLTRSGQGSLHTVGGRVS
jgi:hypothetical protein